MLGLRYRYFLYLFFNGMEILRGDGVENSMLRFELVVVGSFVKFGVFGL